MCSSAAAAAAAAAAEAAAAAIASSAANQTLHMNQYCPFIQPVGGGVLTGSRPKTEDWRGGVGRLQAMRGTREGLKRDMRRTGVGGDGDLRGTAYMTYTK